MQTRRVRRDGARTSDVPEEDESDVRNEMNADFPDSPPEAKPVFLKGLFSVSTTSNRPLKVIRADIIRVLTQLGVEYREIKSGFDCRHAPSIETTPKANDESFPASPPQDQHRRKISFGGFRRGESRDDFQRSSQQSTPRNNNRPPGSSRGVDNSYTNSEDSDEEPSALQQAAATDSARKQRAAGETSTHVQSDLGTSMALRFEIFIVKIPLLSLHGIQFKKVDGGTWQYKNMAQTIIKEVNL